MRRKRIQLRAFKNTCWQDNEITNKVLYTHFPYQFPAAVSLTCSNGTYTFTDTISKIESKEELRLEERRRFCRREDMERVVERYSA